MKPAIVYRCLLAFGWYVGITTKTLEKRRQQHVYSTKLSKLRFHQAFRYELETAIWEVIAICDWETAKYIEIDLVENYKKTLPGICYNMTDGGEGTLGCTWTEESKQRQAERMRGRIVSEETKKKLSQSKLNSYHPLRGQKMPKEWRDKITAAHIGRENTEETKKRMSESAKKRWIEHPESLFEVFDSNDHSVGTWSTQRQCAIDLNLSQAVIGHCLCGNAGSHGGYTFKRLKEIDPKRKLTDEEKQERSRNSKERWNKKCVSFFKVWKPDGVYAGEWNSQHQCAKDLGLKQGKINECLNNPKRYKTHRGYIFKRITDAATPSATPIV
jgi:group I intron endonuclease